MIDEPNDSAHYQHLLAIHRRTLAHYIRQRSGLKLLTPPAVINGIAETTAAIQQCKDTLRALGVEVADVPTDRPPKWFPLWLRLTDLTGIIVGLMVLSGMVLILNPRVYQWVFGVGHMNGELNIAVSHFPEINQAGHFVTAEPIDGMAARMHAFLDTEMDILRDQGFAVAVWEPAKTGLIRGVTPEQRWEAAAQTAADIGADIIIYGTITSDSGGCHMQPEIYIAPDKLTKAEELTLNGSFPLGTSIACEGPLDNMVIQKKLRDTLLVRMQALTDFVIGLQYAAVERFDEANRYFTAAEDTEGWSNREGKEVLYLFLGTAANRTGDHDRAETHYRTALTLNEHYARAYLGLAEVDYQRAVQHHACSPGTVVPAELLEIKHAYEQALRYPAPKIADVETKVAFFTGRVYACLTRSGLGEYRDDTEQTLQLVFDEYYQRENTRITRLVIDAHFVLALAYQALPVTAATSEKIANYRTAAQHYDAALALEPDQEWRAYYYLSLVYTYLQLHTFDPTAEWCAAAHTAYRDAQATRQTIHRSTPYYDAWHDDIVEELETSSCQHPALRVSFFQPSSFPPTHVIDR